MEYSPHTITSMAFSHGSNSSLPTPLNLRLAVGRSNGDIEIWNPRYGWTHEITLYGARGRSIEGLCWSTSDTETTTDSESESPRLFSIGGSTAITEWDLETQKPRANYDCNAGVIWSIDSSKSGNSLAVGCDDGSVVIIDISGGPGSLEHLLICQRQELRVLSVCWYNDEFVVGGCADARLRCWTVAGEGRGRLVGTMRVDKSKTESTLVWSVQVLPKLNQIVSGDSTGSVKFWDFKHFTLLQSFKVHDADVLCTVHDSKETRLFSAGVDRKIHQFQMITSTSNKISKWVHSNSRLLHSNDVRTMSVFELKGSNFLVSGGVEKSIVLLSIANFHDGKYRKLAITQQTPNITINGTEGLVVMWQDQTVKIWKTFPSDAESHQLPYKLVAKLSLSNEENVTSVLVNKQGLILAVSTITSVKLFKISYNESSKKLTVNKIRDSNFDQLIEGSKKVVLYDDNQLLILTTENEIYRFQVNEDTIELVNEIETVGTQVASTPRLLPYKLNISNIIICNDNKNAVISRFNGSIEVLSLDETFEPFVLTKLSTPPNNMVFSASNTLVVITEENKLYEFNVIKSKKNTPVSLLTQWSKRNSEFLPKQFLNLEDKPQGMFTDNQSDRIWIHGSNWLSYFDLSENIPISKEYQNTSSSKKRDRDGLVVQDSGEANDSNVEVNGNGHYDILENNVEILELSLKQSEVNRLREQIQNGEDGSQSSLKPFWMTTKYRPILSAGSFNNGIIVVELPSLVSATPAFNLPKLRV